MKKIIRVIVALMLMLVLIGCAGVTSEQRKDTYDLRKDVGSSQFVGSSRNLDARGMMQSGWW